MEKDKHPPGAKTKKSNAHSRERRQQAKELADRPVDKNVEWCWWYHKLQKNHGEDVNLFCFSQSRIEKKRKDKRSITTVVETNVIVVINKNLRYDTTRYFILLFSPLEISFGFF